MRKKNKVIQIRTDDKTLSLFQLATCFAGVTMTEVIEKAINEFINDNIEVEEDA